MRKNRHCYPLVSLMGYSRKKTNRGVEKIFFWKLSWNFLFFTLPLEIPDKRKLHLWKFHKFLLDPLEIPRPKTKTPGNSTLFFLGHPGKFHMLFHWYPLEISHAISLIPLEIPYAQPPCLFFFWNSPMIRTKSKNLRNLPIYFFRY